MSEKRKDKRNRILHDGEYQRADGMYRFRYIDENGNENADDDLRGVNTDLGRNPVLLRRFIR